MTHARGVGKSASYFATIQPGAAIVADDSAAKDPPTSATTATVADTATTGDGYVSWDAWKAANP